MNAQQERAAAERKRQAEEAKKHRVFAEAERRQARVDAKRQAEETRKQQALDEARFKRQQEQAEETRQKADTLHDKVESVVETVATDVKSALKAAHDTKNAAQRETKAQQELATAERKRRAEDAEKLLQVTKDTEHTTQCDMKALQEQVEAERQKVELFSGTVDSLLDAVSTASEGGSSNGGPANDIDDTIDELAVSIKEMLDDVSGVLDQTPDIRLESRILLADDGRANQRFFSSILKKAGAEVTLAENGQIAVETALAAKEAGNPFDVVLMDTQMPVMDGYDAIALLRNEGYTDPIIAMSPHTLGQDRQKCFDVGCDDYLSKPMDRGTLVATIAKQQAPCASAAC